MSSQKASLEPCCTWYNYRCTQTNADPSAAKALPEGSAGINETRAMEPQHLLTCSFTSTAILAAGSRYSFKLSIHAEASPAMASNWKLATCKNTNYCTAGRVEPTML